jgi:uncharacterized protein YbbC (DUF1343 family)
MSRTLLLALAGLLSWNGVIQVGADRLSEKKYFAWIKGKRIGLITNHTGVGSRLEATADQLAARTDVALTTLFAPEHGLSGAAQAGERVPSSQTVYSLYGENRAPTPAMLEQVGVLLYDIQDVGVRFYTYISTLYESMKAAAAKEIPFIVLDRPNPLGGVAVQGPVLEPGYESFVGIFPLPIRYGMTAGELAQMMNHEAELGCDLRVVPIKGWKRSRWWDETGLQWVSPSPNMPSPETAAVYPGQCLVEGTNLSEGRGTTHPFELVGAPWLDSRRLCDALNGLRLAEVRFRPQAFTPTFSKYQGEVCQGLQLHVYDRRRFDPVLTTLQILDQILALHPQEFRFEAATFDRLAGNSWIREALSRREPVDSVVRRWAPGLKEFRTKREKYLLY